MLHVVLSHYLGGEKLLDNNRHAYLIICHNHFEQLIIMLKALDDERNDFYIHVDKKVANFPKEMVEQAIQKGRCQFVERVEVNWGAFSQINCELVLLKAATQSYHSYYHLISGVDFPIKSQTYIHEFFEQNNGNEYIEFCKEEQRKDFLYRVSWYHLFQEKIGNEKDTSFFIRQWCKWEHRLLKIQRILGIDRIRKQHDLFFKGANWFSITHGLAVFIVNNEEYIKKWFRWSNCGDESFVQVIAMMSPYKENIVNDHLRYIDWERGTPYVFKKEDYDVLKSSQYLWARKFDDQVDREIIDMLYQNIMGIEE